MSRRGTLMTFALATAVISSLAAYGALMMSTSQARRGQVVKNRPKGYYAAEAGLIFARERLWSDPAYAGGVRLVDTDGDGVDETPVTITITAPDALGRRRIDARVVY